MHRNPLLPIVLALALFGFSCEATSLVNSGASVDAAVEQAPLPDFSLEDLDGNLLTKADLDGKVSLVNFWATWCGPCKIEMPWFVDFQRRYKDRGFTVLAVSLDEDGWEPVREFADEFNFNFPVVLGDDTLAEDFGGIWALPTTFIVDRSGTVLYRHTGLVSKATYESEIEGLL